MPADPSPLPPHMFYVLLSLRGRALHGYGIKKDVFERSDGRIDLDAGGLYRLIGRLETQGIVRVAPEPEDQPDDDRRRVFYTLTAEGERLLVEEAKRLSALVESPEVQALIEGAA